MSDTICYLDLHGVLADFVGACLNNYQWCKITTEEITDWDFLRNVLGFKKENEVRAFWKSKGYTFWAKNIQPEPWADELVKVIEDRFGDRIAIVTSVAPDSDNAYEGSCDWIDEHFPQFNGKVIACSQKWLLAHPKAMLIDDNEDTVNKFYQNGGKAILFPRTWNSGDCIDKSRRVSIVKEILKPSEPRLFQVI